MADVIPIDEFITDEWYPGFKPAFDHAPFVVEPFRTFSKEDEGRFWFLDFHWPRGLTPMGLIWNEDGYAWGTQSAAESMPLPPGRGIAQRIAGTHTYAAPIAVESPAEIEWRAQRLAAYLPGFLANFDEIWDARKEELERGWQWARSVDLSQLDLAGLGGYLKTARAYHKRAFEIHFEIMYPLLANYLGFYGLCGELGIDPAQIGRFLQGYDTKIMETDRALVDLTKRARAQGLRGLFADHEPEELAAALRSAPEAAGWVAEFDAFLAEYGWRTEGSCDVALPSWLEDPTPALGMIKTYLQQDTDHDFAEALRNTLADREQAIAEARAQLTVEEQQAFDAALASCQKANFPWWQDDHNYYLDLRVSLPMRWACLEVSKRVGADQPDDAIFLFFPELLAVCAGERSYDDLRGLVAERRAYFDHWYGRRASMPKVLGTLPAAVEDPILIEIFGLNDHFLNAIRAAGSGAEVKTLTGVPASKGVARGTARVLTDADNLHRLQPGEILVCESTSPNWTPAFAKIAACVCDGGGMLSHAAIVGREYNVPTVTAVGLATVIIKDGDEIEVDGGKGTVTILSSVAAGTA